MQIALVPIVSSTPLAVPADLRARLDAAVVQGREEAAGWARIHPTGSTNRFHRDALDRLGPPPTGDAAVADLDEVRAQVALRTGAGNERAVELQRRAGWETWEAVIDEIGRTQGPAQAHRAAQLVQVAAQRTDALSDEGKTRYGRLRPYEVDRGIPLVVKRPDGNPSYPSGHSSGAYAAALVLAAVLPERAAELVGLAAEVAYSRVYGGVHFPSDVVAGARIASAVVADVLRREAAGLPLR